MKSVEKIYLIQLRIKELPLPKFLVSDFFVLV
jgi:hypothetical protein